MEKIGRCFWASVNEWEQGSQEYCAGQMWRTCRSRTTPKKTHLRRKGKSTWTEGFYARWTICPISGLYPEPTPCHPSEVAPTYPRKSHASLCRDAAVSAPGRRSLLALARGESGAWLRGYEPRAWCARTLC